MPEEIKSNTVPTGFKTTPTKPVVMEIAEDFTKAKLHLDSIAAKVIEEYKGKAKYNPFLWRQRKIEPLLNRIKAGENTKELYNQCMAIVVEPPTINENDAIAKFVDLQPHNIK